MLVKLKNGIVEDTQAEQVNDIGALCGALTVSLMTSRITLPASYKNQF